MTSMTACALRVLALLAAADLAAGRAAISPKQTIDSTNREPSLMDSVLGSISNTTRNLQKRSDNANESFDHQYSSFVDAYWQWLRIRMAMDKDTKKDAGASVPCRMEPQQASVILGIDDVEPSPKVKSYIQSLFNTVSEYNNILRLYHEFILSLQKTKSFSEKTLLRHAGAEANLPNYQDPCKFNPYNRGYYPPAVHNHPIQINMNPSFGCNGARKDSPRKTNQYYDDDDRITSIDLNGKTAFPVDDYQLPYGKTSNHASSVTPRTPKTLSTTLSESQQFLEDVKNIFGTPPPKKTEVQATTEMTSDDEELGGPSTGIVILDANDSHYEHGLIEGDYLEVNEKDIKKQVINIKIDPQYTESDLYLTNAPNRDSTTKLEGENISNAQGGNSALDAPAPQTTETPFVINERFFAREEEEAPTTGIVIESRFTEASDKHRDNADPHGCQEHCFDHTEPNSIIIEDRFNLPPEPDSRNSHKTASAATGHGCYEHCLDHTEPIPETIQGRFNFDAEFDSHQNHVSTPTTHGCHEHCFDHTEPIFISIEDRFNFHPESSSPRNPTPTTEHGCHEHCFDHTDPASKGF